MLQTQNPTKNSPAAGNGVAGALWLGTALVEEGSLTPAQLETALAQLRQHQQGTLADMLEHLAMVTPRRIAEHFAKRHKLALVDLTPAVVDRAAARLLSRPAAVQHVILPFKATRQSVEIAVANPATYTLTDATRDFPGRHVNFRVAAKKDILAAIDEAHRELLTIENNNDYLHALIRVAVQERASDIHIENMPNNVRIRLRVDGEISDHNYIARDENNSLVQAVKTAARLNISERRLPQDGQFSEEFGSRKYTFRVSTLPAQVAENAVIRIQDQTANILSFAELGMWDEHIAQLRDILALPYGLIYCTGPTGSGKTTLMYSALATLPVRDLKILTAEEPVEYTIPDYTQVSINERIRNELTSLSFDNILRNFMRHDPDVILVGETRDVATGALALSAALTGHLVFSTLHTNDATGVLSRFLGWKSHIDPFLVASAVKASIGQRLVPRLCPHCREPHPQSSALCDRYQLPAGTQLYRANVKGCPECRRGKKGRIGVFEIFRFDAIAELVTSGASEAVCRARLIEQHGARTLRDDGLRKAAAGLTTIEDVFANLL